MTVEELITAGRKLKEELSYVAYDSHLGIRCYSEYRFSDQDKYYRWKEMARMFLQKYCSPKDADCFVTYSEKFEKEHFSPCYFANMVGILEACEAFPSERVKQKNEEHLREREIEEVLELEKKRKLSCESFLEWHAKACVLFEKWFYLTDEDWGKFKNIDTAGNQYSLDREYSRVYSSYRILIDKLKDGRGLKGARALSNRSEISQGGKLNTSNKISVFVSYSHQDKKWLEKLQRHLKVLTKQCESIDYWDDTRLRGGDQWRKEIIEAINKANVAILLVSADFLASDFISFDELPPILKKAEEEGTRILPLIVEPCDFAGSTLSDFQAINDPGQTLAELGDPAAERVLVSCVQNIKGLV